MEKEVELAYAKIDEIYAQEKGKKFILHLIHAYLPIDNDMYVIGTD